MSEQPQTETAPTPSGDAKGSRMTMLFGALILAVLVFMGGWFIGYRAVTEMEATLARERDAFEAELEEAQESAALANLAQTHAEARVAMLTARQRLAQADDALVSDNFGVARQHLASARTHLAGGTAAFASLAEQAATLEILTAGDTSETRAQLRSLATSLDALLGEAETQAPPSVERP